MDTVNVLDTTPGLSKEPVPDPFNVHLSPSILRSLAPGAHQSQPTALMGTVTGVSKRTEKGKTPIKGDG